MTRDSLASPHWQYICQTSTGLTYKGPGAPSALDATSRLQCRHLGSGLRLRTRRAFFAAIYVSLLLVSRCKSV
jgi:hypothetical protein